jgi:hypothetical protein
MSCPSGWSEIGQCVGSSFCNYGYTCTTNPYAHTEMVHIYNKCVTIEGYEDCFYDFTQHFSCC